MIDMIIADYGREAIARGEVRCAVGTHAHIANPLAHIHQQRFFRHDLVIHDLEADEHLASRCAEISIETGLVDLLITGKGISSRHSMPSSLAAAVYESIVAALYLDGGFGVGKTHLLAAAYHAADVPRAYLSFQEMTYAVGAHGMHEGARPHTAALSARGLGGVRDVREPHRRSCRRAGLRLRQHTPEWKARRDASRE